MISRLCKSARIIPLWLVACAVLLAAAVELLVTVMAGEYPATLAPEVKFYPMVVFLAVMAIGLIPLLWRKYVPHVPEAELDRIICKECGYDLRASKDRCPECGTPISANEVQPV